MLPFDVPMKKYCSGYSLRSEHDLQQDVRGLRTTTTGRLSNLPQEIARQNLYSASLAATRTLRVTTSTSNQTDHLTSSTMTTHTRHSHPSAQCLSTFAFAIRLRTYCFLALTMGTSLH